MAFGEWHCTHCVAFPPPRSSRLQHAPANPFLAFPCSNGLTTFASSRPTESYAGTYNASYRFPYSCTAAVTCRQKLHAEADEPTHTRTILARFPSRPR